MDYFKNFIGLRESDPPPPSGLYVNSLAGITTEILQHIATDEQNTFSKVWQDVQIIAERRLLVDVTGKLLHRFKPSSRSLSWNFNPAGAGNTAAALSPDERGIRLDFKYDTQSLQGYFIGSVILRASNAGEAVMRVRDEAGRVLLERTVNYTAGTNTYVIGRTFPASVLFVSFQSATLATYETALTAEERNVFIAAARWLCSEAEPLVHGMQYANNQYTEQAHTAGVGVYGTIKCDIHTALYYNTLLFTSAWLQLLGNQIMIHLLGTDRINALTTVERTKYEQLRDLYQVDYEKSLQAAVDGVAIPGADCCMICNENPKRVVWLP